MINATKSISPHTLGECAPVFTAVRYIVKTLNLLRFVLFEASFS